MFKKKRTTKGLDMEPLSPEEISGHQLLLEEITTRQVKGFVMIAGEGAKGRSGSDGVLFSNGFSRWEIIQIMLGANATPDEVDALIHRLEWFKKGSNTVYD